MGRWVIADAAAARDGVADCVFACSASQQRCSRSRRDDGGERRVEPKSFASSSSSACLFEASSATATIEAPRPPFTGAFGASQRAGRITRSQRRDYWHQRLASGARSKRLQQRRSREQQQQQQQHRWPSPPRPAPRPTTSPVVALSSSSCSGNNNKSRLLLARPRRRDPPGPRRPARRPPPPVGHGRALADGAGGARSLCPPWHTP